VLRFVQFHHAWPENRVSIRRIRHKVTYIQYQLEPMQLQSCSKRKLCKEPHCAFGLMSSPGHVLVASGASLTSRCTLIPTLYVDSVCRTSTREQSSGAKTVSQLLRSFPGDRLNTAETLYRREDSRGFHEPQKASSILTVCMGRSGMLI
jgi:hypothetical protein